MVIRDKQRQTKSKGENMKQPRKPTMEEKEIISKHGLVPDNWMVIATSKTDIEVISKRTRQRRVMEKRGVRR